MYAGGLSYSVKSIVMLIKFKKQKCLSMDDDFRKFMNLCGIVLLWKIMPSIKVKTKSCASESGPLGTDTVGEEADAQSCFRGGFTSHKCNHSEYTSFFPGNLKRYIIMHRKKKFVPLY